MTWTFHTGFAFGLALGLAAAYALIVWWQAPERRRKARSAMTKEEKARCGKAREEGIEARRKGVVVGDNPYTEDDIAFWHWLDGWAVQGLRDKMAKMGKGLKEASLG